MSKEAKKYPESDQWQDLYGYVLYRYALARVSDAFVAEELVQEAFLAALESANRFREQSTVQTWLIGILRHKIMDHFRMQLKKQQLELPIEASNADQDLFDGSGKWLRPPVAWNCDPHQALQSTEFRQILTQCVNAIPTEKRTVLLSRAVDGLSGREICKLLDITPTHMWVLMHRARGALRRCLEERWFSRRKGQ